MAQGDHRAELLVYSLGGSDTPEITAQLGQRAAAPIDPRLHETFEPLILVQLNFAEQLQLVGAAPLD